MKWLFLIIPRFIFHKVSAADLRGVDFRFQYMTGNLDFTSISGVPRQFVGKGSELQASFYLIEKERFRLDVFLSTRTANWVGQGVLEGEYDDIQTFTVSPGLELQYGILSIAAASSQTNANAYYISSTSKGKQFTISGTTLSAGLNWKFSSLGIGLVYSTSNTVVPGSQLGLSADSNYNETSYGLNFTYYMKTPPGKFFKTLFKK